MQVDEVGGGDLREMADFRGAFAAEMEGWAVTQGKRPFALCHYLTLVDISLAHTCDVNSHHF